MTKTKSLDISPSIIVNPGAGAIEDAHSPESAMRNMNVLASDLKERGARVKYEPLAPPESESRLSPVADDEIGCLMGGTWRYVPPTFDDDGRIEIHKAWDGEHDGRYPFRVFVNGVRHIVEMPGVGLALDCPQTIRAGLAHHLRRWTR